jgi:hypothetical protein
LHPRPNVLVSNKSSLINGKARIKVIKLFFVIDADTK